MSDHYHASSTSPPARPCCRCPCSRRRSAICRAARRRHVGDGDQPPLEDVRGSARTARSPTSASWPAFRPNYKVLMLQGGASLQFSMVPMNLLGAGADRRLHRHRHRGPTRRSRKRKRVGTVNVTGSTKADNYNRIPAPSELELTPGAAYVAHHDEQHDRGHASGRRCRTSATCRSSADASSDIFSGPIDVSRFGLIYAGAQKNLGPVRRHARHHPRGSARALAGRAADDAELQGAGREQLALQHAATRSASTSSA